LLNASATQGYTIKDLEAEKNKLLMEKAKLDVQIAELDSLSNIINPANLKDMEKIGDPNYLVIRGNVQYTYKY
jgi:hypothetical protein